MLLCEFAESGTFVPLAHQIRPPSNVIISRVQNGNLGLDLSARKEAVPGNRDRFLDLCVLPGLIFDERLELNFTEDLNSSWVASPRVSPER